jgi:LuxR family maltose regulon positive regulatory protein
MADENHVAVTAGRSHIIKRPRLTRLLDESASRVILLVAPAGYGKTTLAREWLEHRPHAWYRGSTASADVAALAMGVAEAAAAIVPGAGRRLRERLRVTEAPIRDLDVLIEFVLEDFAAWPAEALVAFDDYQFVCDSPEAERFVETLVRHSAVSFLLMSRKRPSWITARALLYGEAFELGRGPLAMTREEGEAVLSDRSSDEIPGLLSLADGWPAMLSLAARARDLEVPDRSERNALYDFFAEELLRDLPAAMQDAMAKLALAPTLTDGLASVLFGEAAANVIREAVRVGILTPQHRDTFDLHPLLRDFLERKLARASEAVSRTRMEVGRFLIGQAQWDEAFTLIERFSTTDLLVELVEQAMPSLLADGRLTTLGRWLSYAIDSGLASPILDLVEAEIAFREASHPKAQALALQAEQQLHDSALASRALALAGECAYQRDEATLALALHRRAAECARTVPDRRRAIWGQFLAAIQLEAPTAHELLRRVEESHGRTVDGTLRLATARLLFAGTSSHVEDVVTATRPVLHLVDRCSDPKIRTSFLSLFASTLASAAHYDDALEMIVRAKRDAREFRLAFTAPFFLLVEATAAVGLRQFVRAAEILDDCHALAEDHRDVFLDMSARAIRAKMLIAHGAFEDALGATAEAWGHVPGPVVLGESLGVRALALACANRQTEALAVADRADGITRGVEARTLAACARAIVACKGKRATTEGVQVAFAVAAVTQNFDNLVAAVRGEPALAVNAAEDREDRRLLAQILSRSQDHALARHIGLKLPSRPAQPSLLSPREQEVFTLLRQGQTNKQIAAALYLSEATVKVHVRRILSKLGVRSRTQAVLKGAKGVAPVSE